MPTKRSTKVECVNPNTGRKINVDADTYNIFSQAIYRTLKNQKQAISYTDIVTGVKKYFREKKTIVKGSIEWYAVTVKQDMEASGAIESFTEKGKKLHRLK